MNPDIIEHFYPGTIEAIKNKKCPLCGTDIKLEDFKDTLSVKEFNISGMCQTCQDKTFG